MFSPETTGMVLFDNRSVLIGLASYVGSSTKNIRADQLQRLYTRSHGREYQYEVGTYGHVSVQDMLPDKLPHYTFHYRQ